MILFFELRKTRSDEPIFEKGGKMFHLKFEGQSVFLFHCKMLPFLIDDFQFLKENSFLSSYFLLFFYFQETFITHYSFFFLLSQLTMLNHRFVILLVCKDQVAGVVMGGDLLFDSIYDVFGDDILFFIGGYFMEFFFFILEFCDHIIFLFSVSSQLL